MNNKDDYKFGSLPKEGALAAAYVPLQSSANPAYNSEEALSQGTLFPGLDLPFMNMINPRQKRSPKTELMAIDFVTDELELYLDTHKDDSEAFSMLKTFLTLKQEAHSRYMKLYGPVMQSDLAQMDEYSWVQNPWPWDYAEEGEN